MRSTVFLFATVCTMACVGPVCAEEPVPIGDVLADPDAYHVRFVVLQGTVRRITMLPPYSAGPGTTCYGAYTFLLEDPTGAIEISVMGICGQPVLRKPEVEEGQTVELVAQILSPNRLTSASKEEVKPLRAVANEIRPLARSEPPAEPGTAAPAEGSVGLDQGTPPAGDSGY